jgi:hypothetical protein
MRVDTTVVENNIHYPSDSSLLGDRVRVLARTMRSIPNCSSESAARKREQKKGWFRNGQRWRTGCGEIGDDLEGDFVALTSVRPILPK